MEAILAKMEAILVKARAFTQLAWFLDTTTPLNGWIALFSPQRLTVLIDDALSRLATQKNEKFK